VARASSAEQAKREVARAGHGPHGATGEQLEPPASCRVRLRRSAVPLTTVTCRGLACEALPHGHCYVLRIASFGSTTASELRSALRELSHARGAVEGASSSPPPSSPPSTSAATATSSPSSPSLPTTLVFDLRGNEGGLLPEAIDACRMLLPRGEHILSLCKHVPRRVSHAYHCRWYHRRWFRRDEVGALGSPQYIVLVNHGSASSAEVFAGALAHSADALVIGQRTYGKGSSQAVVYQTDGHAIAFTAYTLAVGAKHVDRADLAEGVEPHVRWRWSSVLPESIAADDAELHRALSAAMAAVGQRWGRQPAKSK